MVETVGGGSPTANGNPSAGSLGGNAADDKAKFTFFTDHKFSDVPSYVRYWFMKYNKKHRGFTAYESTMLIKYWALPFSHANEGAMINKQREIRKYFQERVNA